MSLLGIILVVLLLLLLFGGLGGGSVVPYWGYGYGFGHGGVGVVGIILIVIVVLALMSAFSSGQSPSRSSGQSVARFHWLIKITTTATGRQLYRH